MKKLGLILAMMVAFTGFSRPAIVEAYNFGDFRSETLVGKAWVALGEGDVEAVLAYTNKVIELYGEQAEEMQAGMSDFEGGSKDDVFSHWALNDAGTAMFIQGEAYRKAKMLDEAKAAYSQVIDKYGFAQCWDTNGWFWKPANAAKEKIEMMDSGSTLDFGDYTSAYMTSKAWQSLLEQDVDATVAYTNKVVEMYEKDAKEMQNSLTEYPWKSKDDIFSYWALNDVGTSLFIQGEVYRKDGEFGKAKEAYKKVVEEYFYAQCWDPKGWFWKPAEAAQEKIDELEAM